MIRKYASLESAQILDLKGTQTRAKTASLEKIGEFEDYRTEDGYLYARIRAISSRVNKNHDGWPSVELAGGKEVFERHAKTAGFTVTAAEEDNSYGFSTFLGKPIFVDHNNHDPERARGVIVDAKLHVEDQRTASHDPYYSSDDLDPEHTPPTWVELLLEVDAKSFPKLAKAIVEGSKDGKKGIDGFSMGCDVEKSVCNICKNAATAPDEFCSHVKLKGAHFDWINPNTGRKQSKKSYENCYGIKFFEISAVFDPADETALTKEVIAGIHREASGACPHCGSNNIVGHGMLQNDQLLCGDCNQPFTQNQEILPVNGDYPGVQNDNRQQLDPFENWTHNPQTVTPQLRGVPVRQGSVHLAENPLPQNDMMTAPEYVDTLREEEVCPVCGSSMDEGHQCDVCGYVSPPEGLDNPDLDQAQQLNQQQDPMDMGSPEQAGPIQTEGPQESSPVGNPSPNNLQPFSSVSNEKMAWQIYHPKLAGKINPVERPIKPGSPPATNEPQETVLSDQTVPQTNRTAASMIAAVNQGEHMSNARTAADAPTADTRADKRVDVNGVGGVLQGTNEEASKPRGPHSWESDGVRVDVEGKGGVLQDSNAEASKPSQGTEKLPTASESGDDAGFNKDKNIPSQKTQTFPNSNEPNSAVTDKAFPTAHTKQAWGDERAYPTEGGIDQGPASKGAQPADPVGKADDRVDLTQPVTVNNPQKGTDQWTGTGGNGVTRQQDPVTQKVYTGSVVELFKIADTEVQLGLIEENEKYDRIAELEQASEEEIHATAKVLAKVKTAGLKKNAATKTGGVGRVPSFRTPKQASVEDRDESLFW